MLKDKVVFLSGGTGYIGEAIVKKCVEYGARVIFSYNRNKETADKITADIPNACQVQIDLLNIADITSKINELHKKYEKIDILINNAGASQVMPFALIEEEDFDYLINTNIKGTFFLTKEIARKMIKFKSGGIVNVGSIAGHRMLDVPVHYALSKAAISGFTMALAVELKKFNIRVNSIVPGLIEGGISKTIPEELRADFYRHCALGRGGKAEEVAELAAFLASEKSSYINGQNIFIDGGI